MLFVSNNASRSCYSRSSCSSCRAGVSNDSNGHGTARISQRAIGATRIRSGPAPAAIQTSSIGKKLLEARKVAVDLFASIESKGMLTPGRTEADLDKEIFALAAAEFGTRKHWHQRLPRIGENTIHPIWVEVPDQALLVDDIAFVDLGPVFEGIEADFARTYVIGDDQAKHKLNSALPKVFAASKEFYLSNPDMTGAELFAFVRRTSEKFGYQYANLKYCAHLLGKFSHKMEFGMDAVNFAGPDNNTPMSAPGPDGQTRHWVLEIHLLQDPAVGKYGGFYEDLLNLPTG